MKRKIKKGCLAKGIVLLSIAIVGSIMSVKACSDNNEEGLEKGKEEMEKEEPTIENVHGFIEEEKNSEIITDIKQKIIESDDEFKQALFSKENAMLCIICFGAPCNIYIYNTI